MAFTTTMIYLVKRFIAFITGSLSSLIIAVPAYAAAIDLCPRQNTADASSTFRPLCSLSEGNFGQIVGLALQLLFIVAVVVALFFLVWGGIKWILSGGDKSAVEGARNTIVAALVGLAITFLAYFLLTFVIGIFLPGFNLSNLVLPHI